MKQCELDKDLKEWLEPYKSNPFALLNGAVPCPRHICRCHAPNCKIKDSKEYREIIDSIG